MLKKYSEVLGLPVITAKDGMKIGTLKDIVFSSDNKGIIAFILEKDSHIIKGNIILLEHVRSLGNDALIIDDSCCLLDYRKFKKGSNINKEVKLRGLKIYTHSGEDIGVVQDVFFDYRTGKVEGVQVSDGWVQDILMGRNILPFLGRVEINSRNILVDNEAVEEMMSTGGGLRSRLDN
jgi:uncharacterized protein YrrD